MPYNTSRRARERRLRARYRKKIWIAAIVMLIIGLIVGFVACVFAAQNNDRVGELLNLQSRVTTTQATTVPEADELTAPEATFEADLFSETGDEDAQATLDIVEMTQSPVDVEATSTNEVPAMASFIEDDEDENEDADAATPLTVAETDQPEATEAPAIVPAAIETAEPKATESADASPEATQIIEEASAEPTATPTPEVTATPTPQPTPENIVEPVFVPYGQAQTFQTQILADGSARLVADDALYETLDITMQVKAYKDPAYFEDNYADSYNLQGNEAAVEFDITLNNYTGTTEIIPQNFLLITFTGSAEGVTSQGFQLMDSEIAGKTDVAITSDETTTLYKRYPYDPNQGDMTYMVVNTYMDGVEYAYCFEILPPISEETEGDASDSASSGEALSIGSKGDEVKKLQRVLIDNKLLSGEPDGQFGNYTAEAVKEMQRRFDMEPTGVADEAFLERLYAEADQ